MPVFQFDMNKTKKTFDQLGQETAKAFAAFKAYCDLGPDRTTEAVAKKFQKSVSLIRRWATKHQWSARAKDFDQHLQKIAHEAEEAALHKSAGKWAVRIAAVREKDYQMAQQVRAKALRILKAKETKATFGDAVRALKIASDLERLACNMATGKTEVTGPDNTPIVPNVSPVVIFVPDDGRNKPENNLPA